jgi:hypothetical protein
VGTGVRTNTSLAVARLAGGQVLHDALEREDAKLPASGVVPDRPGIAGGWQKGGLKCDTWHRCLPQAYRIDEAKGSLTYY